MNSNEKESHSSQNKYIISLLKWITTFETRIEQIYKI